MLIGASLSEPHASRLIELHRNALWCVRTRNYSTVIKIVTAFHAVISPGTSSRDTVLLAGSEIENCIHAITTVSELKACKYLLRRTRRIGFSCMQLHHPELLPATQYCISWLRNREFYARNKDCYRTSGL